MILAIVPAYNEAARVSSVITGLLSVVTEVVVVDDGSSDETAAVAKAAGATVLVHELNRGQGAALETGHEYAREQGAQVVVHFDADGQFSVADVEKGIELLQTTGADIILGSRFLGTTGTVPWFKRKIILPLARFIEKIFGAARLSDAHNGFRIFNARALSVLKLNQDRMAHATEIPQLIARHKLNYRELPITVTYHEYGQGMGGGVKIIRDLLFGKFL